MPDVVRLYHPQGDDRVAIVSAEPVFDRPGQFLVRLAKGPRVNNLSAGGVYGPFGEAEADQQIQQLVEQLQAAGFLPSGKADLMQALDSQEAKVRARAALRLGWQRDRQVVPKLLAMLPNAIDDLCSLLDALGAIGDSQAAPSLRQYAQRKLLSRRRSAVEALRAIGDTEGLADAVQRAVSELPQPLAEAVANNQHQPILESLEQASSKRLGLYLDTLYEIATPACVAAVRSRLEGLTFAQPYVWRYVKSILKRAQLRHDCEMFGWLAHQIEAESRLGKRISAKVKSGYDGKTRKAPIFSRRTAIYLRRASWRYLRTLARYRPDLYAHAAAEAISAYQPGDGLPPRGLFGQFAHCYLMMRVMYGASGRLVLEQTRLRHRYRSARHVAVPAGLREEAFAELWDRQPRAYLRILARARLPLVQSFALQAIESRHPQLLQEAETSELVPVLASANPQFAEMARDELQRRFDPQAVDWTLVEQLLASPAALAGELARTWIEQSAASWCRDPQRSLQLLSHGSGEIQSLALRCLTAELAADLPARRELALEVAAVLRSPPAENVESLARVARDLLAGEMAELVSMTEALAWLRGKHPPIQAVGADLLANNPEAARLLGPWQIAALAEHEVGAVRAAAHRMLRHLAERLDDDPGVLFQLVDSQWLDTRQVAVELLRSSRDWSSAPVDQIAGLIDSPRQDVQDFAIELIEAHAGTLDVVELLRRVAEHPHPHVRRFALRLAERHLSPGADALRQLAPCLRAVLLSDWPCRESKQRALQMLQHRGCQDAEQAAVAVGLLNEIVRSAGKADFESAMQSLTGILLSPHGAAVAASAAVRQAPTGVPAP